MMFCKSARIAVPLVLSCFAVLTLNSCARKDTHVGNNTGNATFYVDSVTGSFTSDTLTDSQFVNRKFANFTACVKDNGMMAPIPGLQFQISAGSVNITKSTDERGCLVWQELISFASVQDETQMGMTRVITGVEGHSGSETVQLAYDPWNGDKLIFLKREAARAADPSIVNYSAGGQEIKSTNSTGVSYSVRVDIRTTILSKAKKPSFISSMTMQFLKRDFDKYEINSALGLTLAQQYRLKFTSAVLRRTFDQGVVAQNINGGNFRFYFVLLSEGYNSKTTAPNDLQKYVVSANQFETSASIGRFIYDVTLKFNNIAALASRLTGVLTVVSIDQPDTFSESSFEGTLSPIAGGGSQGIDLIPSDLNARAILMQTQVIQAQQVQMTGIDVFAKYSGFVPTDKSAVTFQGAKIPFQKIPVVETFDIMAIFNKMKTKQTLTPDDLKHFGASLCYKYFNGSIDYAKNKAAYLSCVANSDTMIKAGVRDFVEKINNPVPREIGHLPVENLSVSVGMDFSQSNSQSKGTSTNSTNSVTAAIGGGIGVDFGKILPAPFNFSASLGAKMSRGQEWYTTTGVDTTTKNTTSSNSVRAMNVLSDAFKFSIDATTRSCLLIIPSPALEEQLGTTAHPKGKYLCAEQVDSGQREETYYFLNENSGASGSPLSDNMSSEDNPWRMFIRGTQMYNYMTQLFSQKAAVLTVQKVVEPISGPLADGFFMTQEFPGMLSPQ